MTSAAKMKAQPVPETVRVRANLAALGLRRGQETDTALTPMIQGAINSGVLSRIDDPAPEQKTPKRRASGDDSV
jgi:hypothetical protein